MAHIPEHLPQFPEGALIAAVGSVHGRIWLAREGTVEEVRELSPEFTHRTGEGFFWTGGKGQVFRSGTPEAYDELSDSRKFIHLFFQELQRYLKRQTVPRAYVFVVSESAGDLAEHIPKGMSDKVVIVEKKNYAKYHDPLFLIERIARSGLA
ncbi:hypothetical protein D6792_03365 [Candidatus Parcubacteria bacterium]|nr:MAG: hypothetical protein D6792_03365 [Candidatus Parcubacteria bacterium]GIW69071.1 MAG: hypothetical protein KatS3mg100_565 [Candidatus Parcubacteria bacterium]